MTNDAEVLASRRLCVAPMMNRTDRHFRYLLRLLTRCTWLYTEMLVARALLHGDPRRLLRHDARERPLALQLGGYEPAVLANAARIAEAEGFDEINLNVGCPSARVRAGRMGACLMAEPALVGDCIAAMRAASSLPVTVKTRLGIDHHDDFPFLCGFSEAVAAAGCGVLIVHARKAWLHGLDPKANRSVPTLDYGRVHEVKKHFPQLEVIINGGVNDLDTAAELLGQVDGVMLGRAAYAKPLLLAEADARFYGLHRVAPALDEVLEGYLDYLGAIAAAGERIGPALRHLPNLLSGLPATRALRRSLAQCAPHNDLRELARICAPLLRRQAA
ncbi:MAG TPA: tRNA dihydrouridine(20/20a) synthase DusA [Gammaproteobacteria bacterium]|nr:tRNA dihydrouridine(20/20a) synthase DusA [Gammaproteobacteria bacterium]